MTETAGYSIQMIARYTHVSCVILTFILFFVRGIWMIGAPDRLRRPWVRQLPPVIDTLLLASAIVLAISIHQYPLVNGWLTAKVIALLCYIGLGMLALTYGSTRRLRIGCWIAAQLCFLYIVAVALSKQPLPFS